MRTWTSRIGYAYLEAGQLADAPRFLERAAHSCQALDEPLSPTLLQTCTLEKVLNEWGMSSGHAAPTTLCSPVGEKPRAVAAPLAPASTRRI